MQYEFYKTILGTCGNELMFIDIVPRWYGSAHDARIFNSSRLNARLNRNEIDGILLADSGYPLKSYLMTPFMEESKIYM